MFTNNDVESIQKEAVDMYKGELKNKLIKEIENTKLAYMQNRFKDINHLSIKISVRLDTLNDILKLLE